MLVFSTPYHTKIVDEAAKAYVKAAKCESDEALTANFYVEAAMCMKKVNTSEAVKLLEEAIGIFCRTGGIHMVPFPARLTSCCRVLNLTDRSLSGMKKTMSTN